MTHTDAAPETATSLKAYEDLIAAQIRNLSATLEELEARASTGRARAEVAAINGLTEARQRLELQLAALKTAGHAHAARAKTELDAGLAGLHAAIEEFRRTYTSDSK